MISGSFLGFRIMVIFRKTANYLVIKTYYRRLRVNTGYSAVLGTRVASSGQQQYSNEHMYHHQQDIAMPYIPPYRPDLPKANDSTSVHQEQDQSSGT